MRNFIFKSNYCFIVRHQINFKHIDLSNKNMEDKIYKSQNIMKTGLFCAYKYIEITDERI